jgi:membrane peptidoglycan carboxypeptidase
MPEMSLALGTNEVNLLELVSAYAPFANGSTGVWAYGIAEIRDSDGKVIFRRSGSGSGQVMSPELAGTMNEMQRGHQTRHRPECGAAPSGGGQDRHDGGLPRRLVCRLHRRPRRRSLARQ